MANSKRKCKHCKEYFAEWVQLPSGIFCTINHATEWAQAKAKEKAAKSFKTRTRELKAKLNDKDRGYWLKRAQIAFNSFIRARDEKEPCISCQRYHDGKYDAGHYRSVGACPELRFEELNCHSQCVPCNQFKSGNLLEYRINLAKKIGADVVEWLEGKHEPKRYNIEDLKEIEKTYKNKLKLLNNALQD